MAAVNREALCHCDVAGGLLVPGESFSIEVVRYTSTNCAWHSVSAIGFRIALAPWCLMAASL